MARGRSHRKRPDALTPRGQALLESMSRVREASVSLRAASPVSNEQIIAKLVERGAPAEQVAKIKAIMEGRPRNAKRRELADFRRAEIIRLNADGLHDGAIAMQLRITRAYVCQVRNTLGIQPVKRKP